MSRENLVPIQASITGYLGAACTLFSAFDHDTQALVFSTMVDLRTERRTGCFMLTNVYKIDRDGWFEETQLAEAIAAYARLAREGRVHFSEKAQRANPASVIEHDGMDERGMKYRVADEVSNAHVAVLATCLYVAKTVGKPEAVMDAASDFLTAMLQGQSYTVGRDRFNGQPVRPDVELEGFRVSHADAERIKRLWGQS
jgi:hypothetical protein